MLHIPTTATIERLRQPHPDGQIDARRFRPNIVVAPSDGEAGFVENGWLGQQLAIGEQVALHMVDPCPRCVVTTLAQSDLPRDPEILRTLDRHNAAASVTLAPGVVFSAVAGIYARVLRRGGFSGETRSMYRPVEPRVVGRNQSASWASAYRRRRFAIIGARAKRKFVELPMTTTLNTDRWVQTPRNAHPTRDYDCSVCPMLAGQPRSIASGRNSCRRRSPSTQCSCQGARIVCKSRCSPICHL